MSAADLTLRAALLVVAGASLGALARWAAAVLLTRDFPWGTLLVNVAGCFLVAAFAFGGAARGWLSPDLRLFVAVGFLGAFTTMSAFAYDTVAMVDRGEARLAAWNVLANPVLSLAAAWAGRWVGLMATS